jgi:hypothetical protein
MLNKVNRLDETANSSEDRGHVEASSVTLDHLDRVEEAVM